VTVLPRPGREEADQRPADQRQQECPREGPLPSPATPGHDGSQDVGRGGGGVALQEVAQLGRVGVVHDRTKPPGPSTVTFPLHISVRNYCITLRGAVSMSACDASHTHHTRGEAMNPGQDWSL